MGKSECDTSQSGAMQSAVAVALMPLLIFCCVYYTPAVTLNAHNGPDNC